MGEAKQRLEALRAQYLADCAKWSFERSEGEDLALSAIEQLPSVTVTRQSENVLKQMGTASNKCHRNAKAVAQMDLTESTRVVMGWWKQGPEWVLHSVVERNGTYMCVTPTKGAPPSFGFRPDLEVQSIDGVIRRGGHTLAQAVRSDPASTLARMNLVRQRLEAGINPHEAVRNLRGD